MNRPVLLRTSLVFFAASALLLGLASNVDADSITYNAVQDFSKTVNTPSSTWSYRVQSIPGDIATTRPAAPPLLPNQVTNHNGWSGMDGWNVGAGRDNPLILLSPSTQLLWGVLEANANTLYVAPNQYNGLGGGEVLSWLAPESGVISIAFTATNSHRGRTGGPSENWYIDRNGNGVGGSTLASGTLGGYGTLAGTSGASLTDIYVLAGDRINVSFDCGGSVYGGWIGFTETITFTPVPEPASLLLLGTGLIGAVRAVRRKRG